MKVVDCLLLSLCTDRHLHSDRAGAGYLRRDSLARVARMPAIHRSEPQCKGRRGPTRTLIPSSRAEHPYQTRTIESTPRPASRRERSGIRGVVASYEPLSTSGAYATCCRTRPRVKSLSRRSALSGTTSLSFCSLPYNLAFQIRVCDTISSPKRHPSVSRLSFQVRREMKTAYGVKYPVDCLGRILDSGMYLTRRGWLPNLQIIWIREMKNII